MVGNLEVRQFMHATLWDVLVDYVWAVISWWYALIPGIALSILDVVERWRRGEAAIPSRWITGVFVVGVMVAQFLAYKDVVQRTVRCLGVSRSSIVWHIE